MGKGRVLELCRQVDEVPQLTNTEYEQIEAEIERETSVMTTAEVHFYRAVRHKHKYSIARSGWPDFLLFNPKTQRAFCVEVKEASDDLRPNQRKMICMLEQAGVDTYIWCPAIGKTLLPWREFKRKLR